MNDIIDWARVYSSLGFFDPYSRFVEREKVKKHPQYFTVPVLKCLTCEVLIGAFRCAGVSVCVKNYEGEISEANLDAQIMHFNPKTGKVSYFANFERTAEPEETKKICENNSINLVERLLLGYGYFFATHNHLDKIYSTLCMGSCDTALQFFSVGTNASGQIEICRCNEISENVRGRIRRLV